MNKRLGIAKRKYGHSSDSGRLVKVSDYEIALRWFWFCIEKHQNALVPAWLKYVRKSPLGGRSLGAFSKIWREFFIEVYLGSATMKLVPIRGFAKATFINHAESLFKHEEKFAFDYLELASRELSQSFSEENFANDPVAYEHFCAELLRSAGWSAATTAGSGDQGVDVVGFNRGIKIVLQCKLYARPVGNKAVQEAAAARSYEGAQAAAVVSPASFTRSALDLAAANQIALLHHTDLAKWLSQLEFPPLRV